MFEYYRDTICGMMPPHVCIYLSAPVEVIRERINKRNDVRLIIA